MSFFLILILILAVLSFPPLLSRIASLEWGASRGENLLRWAQFSFLSLLFLFFIDIPAGAGNKVSYKIAIVLLIVGYAELLLRLFVKYFLPFLGRKIPILSKVYQYITENPDNLYYSRYTPHPFLQFTGPREPVQDVEGDYYLGFNNIKLSDIPKPEGIIRIACLGGSTTADGYPEFLQEYLTAHGSSNHFQVLNFGMTWWSSVHSTVNYLLNVVDFNPDYLILHDSCNDHHYRGFPGLRGDCAHAYRLFLVPQSTGEAFFRFSLIYRIVTIFLTWAFPSIFRPYIEMKDIGLLPGKTYNYDPSELYIIKRNIETICTIAESKRSRICLTTMPLSGERKFSEEHNQVYRPHTHDVNAIIRENAQQYHCLIADFDNLMTGREEFFSDAVHSSVEGNKMKAETVGKTILLDIQQ